MKAIGILISPTGEEWYDAYGPITKDRAKATVFASAEVADGAAANRFGRDGSAFWNCEREHQRQAEIDWRGWTNRTETV